MKMTPRRCLHPVAIMAGVGKELKNMVVPLLVIMVAGSLNRFSWRDFIVPLAAVVYTVVMGVLSWLRFTYAWDEDRLLVEEGVCCPQKTFDSVRAHPWDFSDRGDMATDGGSGSSTC
ncbi:hypothetical protein JCM14450A_12960 [Geobacillus stearothermophilus]